MDTERDLYEARQRVIARVMTDIRTLPTPLGSAWRIPRWLVVVAIFYVGAIGMMLSHYRAVLHVWQTFVSTFWVTGLVLAMSHQAAAVAMAALMAFSIGMAWKIRTGGHPHD